MSEVTIAALAAFLTAGVNGVAALLGGWLWWRLRPSSAFWVLVRAGQVAAGAQAIAAGVLAATGYDPVDGLYWLYALLPVAIGVVAEQLRIVAAEQVLENRGLESSAAVGRLPEAQQRSVVLAVIAREMGVMAVAAGVVAFLALRAGLIV